MSIKAMKIWFRLLWLHIVLKGRRLWIYESWFPILGIAGDLFLNRLFLEWISTSVLCNNSLKSHSKKNYDNGCVMNICWPSKLWQGKETLKRPLLHAQADCIVWTLAWLILCLCRWGKLDIVSGTGATKYSDQTIMFAAGYLEGALTAK